MPEPRRIASIGGRIVAVIAALALGGAGIAAAALVDWPEHRTAPPSTVVQPAESRQERVCAGPLLAIAENAADAQAVSSFGSPGRATAAEPADTAVEEIPLDAPANANAERDGTPQLLIADDAALAPGMFAAAQSQRAATETIAGLAVAGCAEALGESWLVAGATDVGRTSLVLLANASEVPATVSLEVYGAAGRIDAPAATGIVVPPRTQRTVSLAGLAPDEHSPVVRVLSEGGAVAASLQHSVVRGLQPGGVELVGAGVPPSDDQIIPGFVVGTSGGADPTDDHVDGDDHPIVRLYAPDDAAAKVFVGVTPVGGGAARTLEVTLTPGNVSDVPLGVLDAGAYTVRVQSDAPVVAAARAEISGGDERDFAWYQASGALLERQSLAVPAGPNPTLHLANGGGEPVEAEIVVDGSSRTLEVPAGGAASLAVDAGARVELAEVGGLHAALSYRGGGQLSSFALQPPGPLDSPIRVYSR